MVQGGTGSDGRDVPSSHTRDAQMIVYAFALRHELVPECAGGALKLV
jgi:hypothetical protein